MKLHKEGTATIIIVLILCAITIGVTLTTQGVLAIIFGLLSFGFLIVFGLIVWFFRMPTRNVIEKDGHIMCPSDGKIVVIEKTQEQEYFKDERIQISIFMSPLNVHAQWYPFSGLIKYVKYHKGKYLVAWHPKSSELNERNSIVIENNAGQSVLVRQIAGAVARRIVGYAKTSQKVKINEELGFIKFGSRIDVFLPTQAEVLVKLDEKVVGNQTILAKF